MPWCALYLSARGKTKDLFENGAGKQFVSDLTVCLGKK